MLKKLIAFFISFLLIFEQAGFAQVAPQSFVPGYLQGLLPVDHFRPIHLRYFSLDPATDTFELFLDQGDTKNPSESELQEASRRSVEYFQIGLALPNTAFWVNLRPDSPQDIIDPLLAKTDVGKVLLEADLQLKKDLAMATSPDRPVGKRYWDLMYVKAESLFGSVDEMSIPALSRPWIVPAEVIIAETPSGAYIYKATLKVMLEQDHLKDSVQFSFDDERLRALNDYSAGLIKELILPQLTREVNASRRYASLRQVYYSLIMAQYFKNKLKGRAAALGAAEGSLISRIDSKGLTGLASRQPWSPDIYFKAYQKSFQQGEYNKVTEVYTVFGPTIRTYCTGGVNGNVGNGFTVVNAASKEEVTTRRLREVRGKINRFGDIEPLDDNQRKPIGPQQQGQAEGTPTVNGELDNGRSVEGNKNSGTQGQIGKQASAAQDEATFNGDGTGSMEITDSEGTTHTVGLSREKLDFNGLRDKIQKMGLDKDIESMLLDLVTMFEQSGADVYMIEQLIEDVFGVASSKKKMIGLHKSVKDNPIAQLHEMLEYLIDAGQAEISYDAQTGTVTIRVEGKAPVEIELSAEAREIAEKDPANPHYLLRALQRQMFGQEDAQLTELIRNEQDAKPRQEVGDRTLSSGVTGTLSRLAQRIKTVFTSSEKAVSSERETTESAADDQRRNDRTGRARAELRSRLARPAMMLQLGTIMAQGSKDDKVIVTAFEVLMSVGLLDQAFAFLESHDISAKALQSLVGGLPETEEVEAALLALAPYCRTESNKNIVLTKAAQIMIKGGRVAQAEKIMEGLPDSVWTDRIRSALAVRAAQLGHIDEAIGLLSQLRSTEIIIETISVVGEHISHGSQAEKVLAMVASQGKDVARYRAQIAVAMAFLRLGDSRRALELLDGSQIWLLAMARQPVAGGAGREGGGLINLEYTEDIFRGLVEVAEGLIICSENDRVDELMNILWLDMFNYPNNESLKMLPLFTPAVLVLFRQGATEAAEKWADKLESLTIKCAWEDIGGSEYRDQASAAVALLLAELGDPYAAFDQVQRCIADYCLQLETLKKMLGMLGDGHVGGILQHLDWMFKEIYGTSEDKTGRFLRAADLLREYYKLLDKRSQAEGYFAQEWQASLDSTLSRSIKIILDATQAEPQFVGDALQCLLSQGWSPEALADKPMLDRLIRFINQSGANLQNNLQFLEDVLPETAFQRFDALSDYFSRLEVSAYLPGIFSRFSGLQGKERSAFVENFKSYYGQLIRGRDADPSGFSETEIEEINLAIIRSTNLTATEYRRTLEEFEDAEIPAPNFDTSFTLLAGSGKLVINGLHEEDIDFIGERLSYLRKLALRSPSAMLAVVFSSMFSVFLKSPSADHGPAVQKVLDILGSDPAIQQELTKENKDIDTRVLRTLITERLDKQGDALDFKAVFTELVEKALARSQGSPTKKQLNAAMDEMIALTFIMQPGLREKILACSAETELTPRTLTRISEALAEIKPEADAATRRLIDELSGLLRVKGIIIDHVTSESGGRPVELLFVPAKQTIDLFYGYHGENCTSGHPEELLNPAFTPIRMIKDGKIIGSVHTLTLMINGKKTLLICGIEPQGALVNQLDAALFVKSVLNRLRDEIALKNGYEQIVLSTNPVTTSNRFEISRALDDIMSDLPVLRQTVQRNFPSRSGYSIEEIRIWWSGDVNIAAAPGEAVPHGMANEVVQEGLPDWLRDQPENIVQCDTYQGIPVIPVQGLHEKTGQYAHVGLGQVYGRPVIYIDADYQNDPTVLGHERIEIEWWEALRGTIEEKSGQEMAPGQMRQWIRENITIARWYAEESHKAALEKAGPLGRIRQQSEEDSLQEIEEAQPAGLTRQLLGVFNVVGGKTQELLQRSSSLADEIWTAMEEAWDKRVDAEGFAGVVVLDAQDRILDARMKGGWLVDGNARGFHKFLYVSAGSHTPGQNSRDEAVLEDFDWFDADAIGPYRITILYEHGVPRDVNIAAQGNKQESGKKGGIDFRALPFTMQPQAVLSGSPAAIAALRQLAQQSLVKDLDKEWQEIQKLCCGQQVPYARIKEYMAVCDSRGNSQDRLSAVSDALAQILRAEEDCAVTTSSQLTELLVLVHSLETT